MTRLRAGKAVSLLAFTAAAGLLTSVPAHAIAGGQGAADGAYAFSAKIEVGDSVRSCSGALVAPDWVLTAKSCFPENAQGGVPAVSTKVTVGRTALSGSAGKVVAAAGLVLREDRNLALVRLASPVTDIAPVALARTAPAAGDPLRVAGYGRTATEWVPDRLQTGTATVTAAAEGTLTVLGDGTVSVCRGDSGGPAFREVGGRAELVGVHAASWQGGCVGETQTRREVTEARVDNIGGWLEAQLLGLTAAPRNVHGINVSWLAFPGATGYKVYGARSQDVALTPANLLGTVTGLRFEHTALAPRTAWYYRVVPVTANGDASASLVATATTKLPLTSDFNGDGRDDVSALYDYWNYDTATFTFDGTEAGLAKPVQKWRTGANQWDINRGKYLNGDFNGDGYADLGLFYGYDDANTVLWVRYGSAEGLKDARKVWESGGGQWEQHRAQYVAGDFDGDGKTDIAGLYGYEGGRTSAFLFYGTADGVRGPAEKWNSGEGNWERTSSTFLAGDFNGDGRADLAGVYNYGGGSMANFIFYSSDSGLAGPKREWSATGWWAERVNWFAGDFDGDGRDDVTAIYGYDNSQIKQFLWKGGANGLQAGYVNHDSGVGQWTWTSSRWVVGDYNGDGRTDLIGFYNYGDATTTAWLYRSGVGGAPAQQKPIDAWSSGRGNWEWNQGRYVYLGQ
ncbi:V8-like Glu-specific endopeptidase [Crossiella equi]|uniref:V8-like Glu-specific endopeptidase n=1 Tax=Crossiella equi TaxID=130796 RepID=A0ABS5AAM5_9PSEU|nr:trypsin-like serine protease [Crossiella equi]MBP2473342.1 V8-like Glu-specific endopeptidase [Crossiella equi]